MKVELGLSNYATKSNLKNAAGVDTPKFAKKVDLAYLKSNVDKLDIYTLKNVHTNLNNLKSKVDKSDIDKLVPVPVELSKLCDIVKNDVFKKDVYSAKIKNIDNKIPDITNLATNTTINAKINVVKKEIPSITNLATTTTTDLNAKINEVKNKLPNITNLATTTATADIENKIPNVSNLVKKTDYNTKISEIKNKITADHDHDKYITTQEFNKLASEIFTARLAQANLASKSDIDNVVKKADLTELSQKAKSISTKVLTKSPIKKLVFLMEQNVFILQEYVKIIYYLYQPKNTLNILVTILRFIRGNIMECRKRKYWKYN